MYYKLVDTSGWKTEILNSLFVFPEVVGATNDQWVCTWVSECMGPVRSHGELHNRRLDC